MNCRPPRASRPPTRGLPVSIQMRRMFGGSDSFTNGLKRMKGKKPFDMDSIKLTDAKLSEYAMALRSAEGDSFREIAIREFFGDNTYSTSSHSHVTPYTHHKLQWVHKKFWEEISGFKLVCETDYGWTDEIPPKMMDMDIDLKKTKSIYKSVTLFYENGDKKVVIVISKNDHNNSYEYEVYYPEEMDVFDQWVKIADAENFYKGKKIDASCRFLDLKNSTWNDVILSAAKKQVIQDSLSGLFSHREAYKEFGIPVKRGIILHGPPGTGKTQVCKALANSSEGYSVLYVLPKDFDPQRGGVARIANMAQDLAPCLLIMEDIDFIAKDRQLGSAGMVIELMNYLDGLEEFGDIVTFGTTNHLDIIEDAIKNRPGRFDRLIDIGKPDQPEREAMIRIFTSRFCIEGVDVAKFAKTLGEKMENLAGAHIKDICHTAAAFAARSGSIEVRDGKRILLLKTSHFKEALKEVSTKDYASHFEAQQKGEGMGFGTKRRQGIITIDDDIPL
jgi:AAA+ superfamily predicted ATPase